MRRKNLKKIIATAMVLALAGTMLAGCTKESPAEPTEGYVEPVTDTNQDDSRDDAERDDAESDETAGDAIADAIEQETSSMESDELFELYIPNKYNIAWSGECGTVEEITYMTYDYIGDGDPVEKEAVVYLPAGYSEDEQYDVIYLMHGIGGNEHEWGLDKDNSKIRKMLDNMIGLGEIKPVIVVAANGRALACQHTDDTNSFYQFGYELRNDLIPYIESHYATYAEYSEDGYDLTATRRHRAMCGLSMGGMQTINIGVCECLDIMSYFGSFSAAPTSYSASIVADAIDSSEYDIDYFYNICGTEDTIAYASASNAVKNLDFYSEKMIVDENYTWQEKTGTHDFGIWYLGFFNFLKIAFTKE